MITGESATEPKGRGFYLYLSVKSAHSRPKGRNLTVEGL